MNLLDNNYLNLIVILIFGIKIRIYVQISIYVQKYVVVYNVYFQLINIINNV